MLSENQTSLPSWGSSFSGKGTSFGDQIRQRDQMAAVMHMAIKSSNLETAKRAMLALIQLEESLKSNPILIKINDALLENNALAAQEFAAFFCIETLDSVRH